MSSGQRASPPNANDLHRLWNRHDLSRRTACVACPDGQTASPDRTECLVASQVGESGTCELTGATTCVVLTSVALTDAVPSYKTFASDAAGELANGFVLDSDNDFIANLYAGPCDDVCGGEGHGGIVVAPVSAGSGFGKHDTAFTVEFAVESADDCQGLIGMFTSQLADPHSDLVTCAGDKLLPCWTLDRNQTLATHCIDATESGR